MQTMNVDQGNNGFVNDKPPPQLKSRHWICLMVFLSILLLLMVLFMTAIILALTSKPKAPRTEVISTTLEGVAPKVSFPAFKVDLNITVHLNISVENPNYASFDHGPGQTLLVYKGYRVGDAELEPGLIPARSSSMLGCRLTLQVDKFLAGSNMMVLVSDVIGGQVLLETHTEIPGEVKFWWIFAKHVVTTSDCRIVVRFPDLKVEQQYCSGNTKF